jgi:multiple sugar transport system substrate-binding protein
MSFQEHDRQGFIIDAARGYAARRLPRRAFLQRMAGAGIGFSSFALALLGGGRGPGRGLQPVAPAHAQAQAAPLGDSQARWLKEVGGGFRGATVRFTSEATPPTLVLDRIKREFTEPTGIEVEIEIVPLEQVLARAMADARGQLGSRDLYYLDQSWVAAFAEHCVDPVELAHERPELAMPGFDFGDFCRPLVEGMALHGGRWRGIPFDIPIFILMYREDLLDKHGLKAPATYPEFLQAATAITRAEKANGIFGTGLQAKSGHYSLECDWSQAVWGHGGSIFGRDGRFAGNDAAGLAGLAWYRDLLAEAAPESTLATWDGQAQMMRAGRVALVQSWAEFFPALDAVDSSARGLWQPARPLAPAALRAPAACGFGERPDAAHQGGSLIALSRHSKNRDAAWIFLQWATCQATMTRCTLEGGFAPTRTSCFADPAVRAKAKVTAGTTRHLDVVHWTIEHALASEPHFPQWLDYANGALPGELGKLLTGQAYHGDAQACMDAVARLVDDANTRAGLLRPR